MKPYILAAALLSASAGQVAKSWSLTDNTYAHNVRAQVAQTIETGGSLTSPSGEIFSAEGLTTMHEWAVAHAKEIELFDLLHVTVGPDMSETDLIGATWFAMRDIAESEGILSSVDSVIWELNFERQYRAKKGITLTDDIDALETFFRTKFDPGAFEIAAFLGKSRKDVSLSEVRAMAQKTLDYVRWVGDNRDFEALEIEKLACMQSVETSRTNLGYSLEDLQLEAGEEESEQRAREYLEKHAPGFLMPPPERSKTLPTQIASPNEQRV